MSNAEVLRIIDIGPKREEAAEPESEPGAPPKRGPAAPTAKLALWPSPAETAIVTHAERVPLIDVDQLAPEGQLDPRVVLLRDPTSEAARSFRLLRHRLHGMGDPRVIALTSARSGEGKTTCAV